MFEASKHALEDSFLMAGLGHNQEIKHLKLKNFYAQILITSPINDTYLCGNRGEGFELFLKFFVSLAFQNVDQ